MIGDDVMITVLETKNNQVRLGIDAPKHVKVLRDELVPHDEFAAKLEQIGRQ